MGLVLLMHPRVRSVHVDAGLDDLNSPQVAPARQSAHPRAQAERHRGRGCRLRRRRQPRLPASAGGGAKAPAQPGPRRAHRRTARGCRRRCPTSLWHATVAPRAAPHSSAGSPERHGRRVDPLISETDGQGSPEHAQGHKDEVSAHIPTDRSSGAWRSRVRCTRPDNTAPVVRMPLIHLCDRLGEARGQREDRHPYGEPPALPADCETTGMARLRREARARMLGNGLCTRPAELDCRMESACETLPPATLRQHADPFSRLLPAPPAHAGPQPAARTGAHSLRCRTPDSPAPFAWSG